MIASDNRFHGQNGLKYVYRKGRTVRTKFAQAKFTVNKFRTEYRASVVISKKVAKSAVVRNRIRRRIYEQVRIQAPHYLKNHDVVITIYDASLAVCESVVIEDLIKKILVNIKTMSQH